MLPDLVVAAIGDLSIERRWGSRFLRLSVNTGNVGEGPFEIELVRSEGVPATILRLYSSGSGQDARCAHELTSDADGISMLDPIAFGGASVGVSGFFRIELIQGSVVVRAAVSHSCPSDAGSLADLGYQVDGAAKEPRYRNHAAVAGAGPLGISIGWCALDSWMEGVMDYMTVDITDLADGIYLLRVSSFQSMATPSRRSSRTWETIAAPKS